MPGLLSCSDELLVMIASQLRFSNSTDRTEAQHDAVALAQTCLRLKGAVDDVLYHNAIVSERRRGASVFGGSYLLRTLVRHPRFALRIRSLEISVIGFSDRVGHTKECPFTLGEPLENCLCGWLSTAGRVEEILTENDLFAGLDTLKQKWLRGIRFGKEPAILGALLACLPNLRSLTIHKRGVSTVTEYPEIEEGYTETTIAHGQLDPWRMFGLFELDHEDNIHRIPGLAQLEHLSTDCLPPMSMVRLPKLKTLQLHAFYEDNITAWNPFSLRTWDVNSLQRYFSTDLRKLTLLMDNDLMVNDTSVHPQRLYYIPVLIARASFRLTDLVLKLMPNGREDHLYARGCYQRLIWSVRPLQVHTLVIDSAAIKRPGTGPEDYTLDEANECFKTIQPCTDISALLRLRKFVVHQEVLFNVNVPFSPCVLPTSIRELGVVGTTRAMNRWARYMRDSLWNYPKLKLITLWVADESERHFAADVRLQFSQFDSDDEEEEDEEDYEDYYDEVELKEIEIRSVSMDEDVAMDSDDDEYDGVPMDSDGDEGEGWAVYGDGDGDGEMDDGVEDMKEQKPTPRFTGRSLPWAELEKAGIEIVLAYHRGRPWDEL